MRYIENRSKKQEAKYTFHSLEDLLYEYFNKDTDIGKYWEYGGPEIWYRKPNDSIHYCRLKFDPPYVGTLDVETNSVNLLIKAGDVKRIYVTNGDIDIYLKNDTFIRI